MEQSRTQHSSGRYYSIHEKLNVSLILPNATRWNSYYYANATDKIRVVIDQCAKYNDCEVFSILEVPLLKSEELVFLNEVCKVMQPLACSLDILQGERKS